MVRIAVVQMDFHPAFTAKGGRVIAAEPLGHSPDAYLPFDGPPSDELLALRERVTSQYERWLARKLVVILEHCRQWKAQIVVFPEYSIRLACLTSIANAATSMVVVAGTHYVGRPERKSSAYQDLGVAAPPLRTAVSPVLHGGRALALVPKCRPAPVDGEADALAHGEGWRQVELPEGFPGPLGVAICFDFIGGERPACADPQEVAAVRLWAVPSLTHKIEEFYGRASVDAKRRKQPVAFANAQRAGGSCIFVDARDDPDALVPLALQPGEEGVLVADVDWKDRRPGKSTAFDERPIVTPVAAASFVHAANPIDEQYATWLGALGELLERTRSIPSNLAP